MSKSIMSNEKVCYICHATSGLHKHHIFFGTANRKISESDGCWCWLCATHHTLSKFFSVHNNREVDLSIKRKCQEKWEEINGTREDFIKRYGKSYL